MSPIRQITRRRQIVTKYRPAFSNPIHLDDKPCEFNGSMQHLLAVYWQGSGTLKFFAVVG